MVKIDGLGICRKCIHCTIPIGLDATEVKLGDTTYLLASCLQSGKLCRQTRSSLITCKYLTKPKKPNRLLLAIKVALFEKWNSVTEAKEIYRRKLNERPRLQNSLDREAKD